MKTNEICGGMTVQHDSNCMSQRKVYEWIERFKGLLCRKITLRCLLYDYLVKTYSVFTFLLTFKYMNTHTQITLLHETMFQRSQIVMNYYVHG